MADLVLFSGGCDSTLVLYTRAMNALKFRDTPVNALSINHNQVPSQNQQQQAREKIKAEFIKRELPINWLEVNINNINSGGIVGGGCSQPVIWLPTATMYLYSNDTLYTGYHRGDDFWRYKSEAEIAFINFAKIMDKHDVKINHMLEFDSKGSIIQKLKDRGLYDLCWYCEYPTIDDKPCGTCDPCKTHRTALWQNETFNTLDSVIEDLRKVSSQLKKDDPLIDDGPVQAAPSI